MDAEWGSYRGIYVGARGGGLGIYRRVLCCCCHIASGEPVGKVDLTGVSPLDHLRVRVPGLVVLVTARWSLAARTAASAR
jgi:hypothetical protein